MTSSLDFPLRLDPFEYRMLVMVVIVVAVGAFIAAFVSLCRARLIEDTPTSRIRSAAQAYVELEGEAVMMEGVPIVAPLTLLPCAWFRYRVEERVENNRGDARWRTLRRGTSDGIFVLRDDTGDCVVDPDGATVTPSACEVWYGDTPTPPPVRRNKTVWRHGGRYRYREERIHAGDYLYAIGEFRSTGGAEGPAHADAVRALLAEWKRDRSALLARFDDNRDGAIDVDEWGRARRAAEQEVVTELALRSAEPEVALLSRPRSDPRPFLLSTLPPRDLILRYRLLAAGLLALFAFAAAVAFWLVHGRIV